MARRLKVGLILECGPDGADKKVCEHLAQVLAELIGVAIETSSITLDSKPGLVEGCGPAAQQLLEEGCHRVLIIWDLFPPWRQGGEAPCRRDDRESILESLGQSVVDLSRVHLVCIREELEAWLLADGRALSRVLSRRTRSVKIVHQKSPEQLRNPKKRLTQMFQRHTGQPYSDRVHAEMIVRALPDLNRIRRCPSFVRFAIKVAGRSPW